MVLVALIAVGLAACGGDDEDTADQTTTTEDPAAKQKRDYCDKSLQVETAQPPPGLFEAPPAQQKELVKQFASQILPLGEEAQRIAPPEIKTDIDVLVGATRTLSQSGDFRAFGQPNFEAAEQRVHVYDLQNCGWKRVDVAGVDYAFQGIPQTLAAGPTSFELANKASKEDHELAVLRINDDVKEPFADIVKQGEQARQKVRPVGQTEAEPGKTDYAIVKLEPGRYAVSCFIPVGGREDGPPHAARGMFAEFTVS